MKTYKDIIIIFIFQLCLLLQNVSSQYIKWSPIQKITETNSYDQHPTFGNRTISRYSGSKFVGMTMLAFDRTDSIGTNICVLNVDNNQGWSKNVQYITQGKGINEYPSLALGDSIAMLVYQSKQEKGHNIFYSILDSRGWSTPSIITNDTDQDNIHPYIMAYDQGESYAVVWEKNGKICYRDYNGSSWSDIVNLTPNDSLNNSNPIVFAVSIKNSDIIIWQRSKYSNPQQNDLFIAYNINNIWIIDTLTTQGNNIFPVFCNDKMELFWEKQTGERWEIYGTSGVPPYGSKWEILRYLYDPAKNYKQFRGIAPPRTASYNKKNVKLINDHHTSLDRASVWVQERDTSEDIILSGYGYDQVIQLDGSQKNPTIGAFSDIGGWRAWAVWESNHTGRWDLYGSTVKIPCCSSVERPQQDVDYSLYQNYPNPFNPSTVINYQLQLNSFVTLKIYNILGKEIATLLNEKQTAGMHSITWEAKNIPAGVYFYRLQTERYNEVKKMVLIK